MKFHKQDLLWSIEDKIPTGSCYPTVIACLLDLPINKIPYVNLLYFSTEFEKKNLEERRIQRFLHGKTYEEAEEYEKNNYTHDVSMQFSLWNMVIEIFLASQGYYEAWIGDLNKFVRENPETPYIISGTSLREVSHVVIGMNGKFYHDPHPSNTFLKEGKHSYSYLDKIEDYHIDKYISKLEE